MMKNIKKYSLLLLLVTIFSCNEYLDTVPDQRLEVDNIDKIEATLVGAYQNRSSCRFTHFSTDDVSLTKNVFFDSPALEDLYTWSKKYREETHQDSPAYFWVAFYEAIAQTNLALEKIPNVKVNTAEEKQKLALLKAEALIVRSYNHFMLVNIFGKHYDKASSSTDLGIPYVEKVESKLVTKYKRENVETVYNKAEKDLLEGIAIIEKNINAFNNNRYRFTPATIYAYATRFYTFRNKDVTDQNKVLKYAEKSLSAFDGAGNMDAWTKYFNSNLAPINIESSSVGMVQASYTWVHIGNKYQATQGIQNNILRRNPFGLRDNRLEYSYMRSGDVFVPAFYFSYGGGSGKTATDIFPLSEVILNKAEAHIRKKEYDKASKMLKVIGEKCYRNYNNSHLTIKALKLHYKTTSDEEAWTSYLLHERRLTLFMKGFRWFDIKRYNIEVEHLLKGDDGKILKLSEELPNKVYQLPSFAITAGLTPN